VSVHLDYCQLNESILQHINSSCVVEFNSYSDRKLKYIVNLCPNSAVTLISYSNDHAALLITLKKLNNVLTKC